MNSETDSSTDSAPWYIVKQPTGECEITTQPPSETPKPEETWGPFANRNEAIARRVGLIRAGKCQPV